MYQSMNQPTYHQPTPMPGEFQLAGDVPAPTQSHAESSLQMNHGLSSEVITSPINPDETYYGSLKAMLSRNIGNYVVVTYLVGTQSPVSWEGYLHTVGNDYLVIYQPDKQRYISGDYYALKFVEFYEADNPGNVGYRRRDGQRMW